MAAESSTVAESTIQQTRDSNGVLKKGRKGKSTTNGTRPTRRLAGIALAFLIVCAISIYAAVTFRGQPGELARVDGVSIYASDVEIQTKIDRIMGGDPDKIEVLEQLVDAFAKVAVLKRQGFDLGENAIASEAARIDSTTQDPDALKLIKSLFAKHEDYLRVFILPTLASRAIYFDFYRNNFEIHQESRRLAEELLTQVVSNPEKYFEIAEAHNLKVTDLEVPVAPSDTNRPGRGPWPVQVYSQLSAGEVAKNLVESDESFVVARRHKQAGERLEIITVPKRPFSDWFANERARLKIQRFK